MNMSSTKLAVVLVTLFALLNITSGSVPSAPIGLTIDETGSRGINISWTRPAQDGNSSQLEYDVFYARKVLRILPVQNETKASISGLKPYMKYDIYVMAKNTHGYGPSTLKRSQTTLQEAPGKCPEVIHTERDHTGRNLDVGWNKVPEEYQNGPILGYVIFYQGRSMTSIKNVTIDDPNKDLHTFINFTKEENYGFKVAAFNSKGLCNGYQNISLEHEGDKPTTSAPATTVAVITTVAPTTTAAPTTVVTSQVKETTKEATKEPSEGTTQPPSQSGCKTEEPGEALARTAGLNWLVYVAIALAIIIVIMGVTIFLLIWQLYKNHRFYKLRQEQYKMRSATPNMGVDNAAQDNAV